MLGSQLFMTAFHALTSSRSHGLEMGPIPWGAIQDWCDRNDIEGEQREDVMYHVRSLDNAYLEECRKKAKQKE